MKPTLSFFIYELRSDIRLVLEVWATWLFLPIVHRIDVGHWAFWREDFAQDASVFFLLLTLPVLATLLCRSRWAKERSEGTLDWLYARPLSARALFLTRLAAIVTALVVFTLGVFLLTGLSWAGWSASLAPWGGASFIVLLGAVGLAAGLAASALAKSQGQAGILIFASVTAVWLLVRSTRELVGLAGPWQGWEILGDAQRALPNPNWFIPLCILVMGLAVAWAAVRHSPVDPRVTKRVWRTKLAPIALALLVFSSLPLFGKLNLKMEAFRDLGDGWRVELLRNSAMEDGDRQLHLVKGQERVDLERTVKSPDLLRFADPEQGRAMLRTKDGWLTVSRDGEVHDLEFVDETEAHALFPVGWSPADSSAAASSGKHFAWIEYEVDPEDPWVRRWDKLHTLSLPDQASHLVLWNEVDQGRRLIEVPSPLRLARWLDAEHILLTESTHRPGPWMVVSVDGSVERPEAMSDVLAALFPPASGAVALVPGPSDDRWELARLEAETGTLTTLTELPKKAGAAFATLPDGRPTWLTFSKDAAVTWTLDADAQVREVCRTKLVPGNFSARFRGLAGEADKLVLWEQYYWYAPDAKASETKGPNPKKERPRLGTSVRFLSCDLETGEGWVHRVQPRQQSISFDVNARGLQIGPGTWLTPDPASTTYTRIHTSPETPHTAPPSSTAP